MRVKMRVKGWLVVALAVVVSGSGTGVLAREMIRQQDKEVTEVSSVSGGAFGEKKKMQDMSDLSEECKEIKEELEKSDYKIEMLDEKSGSNLKRTKADLSPEKAIGFVAAKIQELFGDIRIKKVVGVCLDENGWDTVNSDMDLASGYRAYQGMIRCEGGMGFEFTVNSITGQMISLLKVTNTVDPDFGNPSKSLKRLEQLIKEKKGTYGELAEKYTSQTLKAGEVVKSKIQPAGSAGQQYGYHWERVLVTAVCTTEEGAVYNIWIDPDTDEIVGWDVWIA